MQLAGWLPLTLLRYFQAFEGSCAGERRTRIGRAWTGKGKELNAKARNRRCKGREVGQAGGFGGRALTRLRELIAQRGDGSRALLSVEPTVWAGGLREAGVSAGGGGYG
jgi:hypothetical protein